MSAVINGGGVAAAQGVITNGRGGRFQGTDRLTDKESVFVRELIRNGGNKTAAADVAGYAYPNQAGWELCRRPRVLDAIRRARQHYIDSDLANLAAGTMRDLMTDKATPAPQRFQAARWCLEQAGHNAKEIQGLIDDDRPMTEWSPEQLQHFVAAGAGALEAIAQQHRAIDITPTDSPADSDNAQDSAQSGADIDVLD